MSRDISINWGGYPLEINVEYEITVDSFNPNLIDEVGLIFLKQADRDIKLINCKESFLELIELEIYETEYEYLMDLKSEALEEQYE